MTPRRRFPRWLLVLLLVAMPLTELYVLIQVGQVIGAGWTVLMLLGSSVVGSWLIRREGSRAWKALNATLAQGRMPTRELADGALVVAGGIFMIAPGFVSDLFGLFLVLPVTRPVARRLLRGLLAGRVATVGSPLGGVGPLGGAGPTAGFGFGPGVPGGANPGDARRPGPGTDGSVVRGEVVDP